jgi:hypothetical protein
MEHIRVRWEGGIIGEMEETGLGQAPAENVIAVRIHVRQQMVAMRLAKHQAQEDGANGRPDQDVLAKPG